MKNGVREWGEIRRQIVESQKNIERCIKGEDYAVAEYWKGWLEALSWVVTDE